MSLLHLNRFTSPHSVMRLAITYGALVNAQRTQTTELVTCHRNCLTQRARDREEASGNDSPIGDIITPGVRQQLKALGESHVGFNSLQFPGVTVVGGRPFSRVSALVLLRFLEK